LGKVAAMAFEGKSVVVTGGASGIGEALCRAFAARGARVMVADLDAAGAAQIAREVGGASFACDVGEEAAIRALVEQTVGQFGGIDVMVSNAGIAPVCDLESPAALWDKMWRINFMAHVHAAKYALPPMLAAGGGSIAATASAIASTTSSRAPSRSAARPATSAA
jgi:NAD(P)-dependent dehydrogenase (short-subunit alcohol dehydrogenase family)